MRMTFLRKQIVTLLRPPKNVEAVVDRGMPPYTASNVAEELGSDVNNVSKTMRQMEEAGLLTSEKVDKEVFAHLMQRDMHVTKKLKGYWVTEHMEEDKEQQKRLEAERKVRAEKAMDTMFERFG